MYIVIELKGVFELFITYNFYADSQADITAWINLRIRMVLPGVQHP